MPVSQIPNTFVVKYDTNVRLALNQNVPLLAPLAIQKEGSGEKMKLDDIVGSGKTIKQRERNGDTMYGESTHDRVWVVQPIPDVYARLVDKQDQLASGIELAGIYVQDGAAAINRAKDDAFLAGFFADMITGKSGTVASVFAAANVVPVDKGFAAGTAGRMNIEKVRGAAKIMAKGFVNPNQPWYMQITAEQVEDLTGQVTVINKDYSDAIKPRFSADGKSLSGLLGFEFVTMESSNPLFDNAALTLDGSGYRKNMFWSKDGMAMVSWEDLFTDVVRLPGKNYSTQVYARTAITATRTDNARAGYILNSEA